jgi:hypothetical protein
MFDGMRKIETKIRRSNELQASQVMQTGTVTLNDAAGNSIYNINYAPKATHFPTAGTAWSNPAADALGDLEALMEVIRNDGKVRVNRAIMGIDAFDALLANTAAQTKLDLRRGDTGSITPMTDLPEDASYRGTIDVGNYKIDIITYAGRFYNPETQLMEQYLDPSKVVLMSAGGTALEASFGDVPHIGRAIGKDGRELLPELPTRFGSSTNGMDMFTNVWLSDSGEQLYGGVSSRPLFIPKGIDTFGTLETNA